MDGRGDTRSSGDWVDDTWFMVDLGEVKNIDAVSILWQTAYGSKYRILVSEDKENWTNVVKDNNGEINGKPGRVVTTFQSTPARYVKFEGVSRATMFGYSFEEFEVYGEEYKLGNLRPIIDLLTAIEADIQPLPPAERAARYAHRLEQLKTRLPELEWTVVETSVKRVKQHGGC